MLQRSRRKSRIHACNLVLSDEQGLRLWRFSVGQNRSVQLTQDQTVVPPEGLPQRYVKRDWRALVKNWVNVAWLPADQVFLRVAHLPTDDPSEVQSMIELQLEKLSPLPPSQIVWSYETLPRREEAMLTAIVIIVNRTVIEGVLGKLESQGFQPDRLELPFLHQLLSTEMDEEGVWIFPGTEGAGSNYCLIAWYYQGRLQSVSLLYLGEVADWAETLVRKVDQVAWAGEIEGWLTGPPRYHLVADEEKEALWRPALSQLVSSSVRVARPMPTEEIAAYNARRVAEGEDHANLLPEDYASRYRQEFTDNLWMGSLGVVIALYLVGVVIYFGTLNFRQYQLDKVDRQVASLSQSYTNALELQEQIEVLRSQLNLRFAALDAWKAAVESLPEGMVFRSFQFQDDSREGQRLTLHGTARNHSQVTDYSKRLNQAQVDGRKVFRNVDPSSQGARQGSGVRWDITCYLRLPSET